MAALWSINAEINEVDYEVKHGKTYIYKRVFPTESLLLQLADGKGVCRKQIKYKEVESVIDFKENVSYEREEENVYILDMAQYRLDDGELMPTEELIIIDDNCRKVLNYPKANGCAAQPWILGDDIIEHYVTLKFKVKSECEFNNISIAAEEAECILVNGENIALTPCGYYVDESIKKYYIGKINKGDNTIEIKAPIGKRTSIENFFLLGDFDVQVRGTEKLLLPSSDKIGFSDVTSQGMPFYGGNIRYKTEIDIDTDDIIVRVNRYRGAAVKVYLDGEEKGIIAYSPYHLKISGITKGKHNLEFKLLGNRVNTFGSIHACDYSDWFGPNKWYTYSEKSEFEQMYDKTYSSKWSYEYVLKQFGILSSPVVYKVKKYNLQND